MRYVPIAAVKPGEVLGRTVYDAAGNTLLTTGTVLQSAYLQRLSDLGYSSLYIRSQLEGDDDQEILEPVRAATRLRAQATLQRLSTDLQAHQATSRHFSQVAETAKELVMEILANRDVAFNMIEVRCADLYTFSHSVNTCVVSLLGGVVLGYDYSKLVDLGTGALLHDLGKTFVPSSILNKPARLTAEEYSLVKEHCLSGYRLLRNQISPLAAHVAYQHHERCDGTGYPRGLKADETIPYARLVAVADSLDAMTSDRVYSKGVAPHEAAVTLLRESADKYDREFVEAVIQCVAPYPIGSLVQLDTGELAEVVGATRLQTEVLVTRGARRGQRITCPGDALIAKRLAWDADSD